MDATLKISLDRSLIVLSRRDLAALMRLEDYVEAVAAAFRLHAMGRALAPAPLHVPADGGGFHVKAGSLPLGSGYAAFKINANFPDNRRLHGLPTIQGAILLFDAVRGVPLALIDSIEITIKRTGAATAVAARHLARPNSRIATICGCGEQGRVQLMALRHGLAIDKVFFFDRDRAAASRLAQEAADQGLAAELATSLREATIASDVIATCTPSHTPFLGPNDVRPGTFIAAIGADNPEKNEIEPTLMARARVVADVVEQGASMGDLHHAIRAGAMQATDVHAELGELVIGRKTGRMSPDEITIFDGTGVGIQDVAAAARAYEMACDRQAGSRISLG